MTGLGDYLRTNARTDFHQAHTIKASMEREAASEYTPPAPADRGRMPGGVYAGLMGRSLQSAK